MRGWMNEGKSYIAPVGIGEVMRAGGIGRVITSQHTGFAVGDHVSGTFGVQNYALSDGKGVFKVNPQLAPLPVYLGTLGMPGMTAYFGLLDVGRLEERRYRSGLRCRGCRGHRWSARSRRSGSAASSASPAARHKCAWLVKELGFDAAIDHKAQDVKKTLREHCPKGMDVYFDNVGGDILDAALTQLARGARIVICGAISQYNNTTPVQGPANYLSLLVNRASMTGMVVFDYAARYPEAVRELGGWLAAGKMKSREHIVTGLETFPEALLMLFRGENTGKLVLKV